GEWIRAARPEHPALIDPTHRVAALYGMVNVPTSAWIDERGRLVRWGEVTFADNRWQAYTKSDMEPYLAGLRDWVRRGAASPFALAPAELRRRLPPPTPEHALAAATFRMGEELHARAPPLGPVAPLQEAQRLHPENWRDKPQAW